MVTATKGIPLDLLLSLDGHVLYISQYPSSKGEVDT